MDYSKPAYRPTHVEDDRGYDMQRGTHRVKRVHFILADGTKSYVELPHDAYNAESVQQALQAAADDHFKVMAIQGPPAGTPVADTSNPWSGG